MGGRAEDRLGPTSRSLAWRNSWQAALLAASILTSGFLPTQARDVNVTVEPSQTLLQGQDVTLTPGGAEDFLLCRWFRGVEALENRIFTYFPLPNPEQQISPGFSGRETAGPGCSLHIQSVALNDSGTYIVSKTVRGSDPETGHVQLDVIGGKERVLLGRNATLTPGGTADFLACSWYRGGSQDEANRIFSYFPSPTPIQWNGPGFSGREMAGPNCSLHIQSVALSDNGTYTVSKIVYGGDPETGRVNLEVIGSLSSSRPGVIWGIVFGAVAVAALAGTLLYYFFRAQSPKNKSSEQTNPTSPVYENTRPPAPDFYDC